MPYEWRFCLASDAPINDVISGAVTLATTPPVGSVVFAHAAVGSGGARHVCTTLQLGRSGSASRGYRSGQRWRARDRDANVSDEHLLQANDVAHFVSEAPQAPAARALNMSNPYGR